MIPLVALIGRPNVGKSTLFNRLVGKRLAIVHDLPGVTRDRHYADALLEGRTVTLIDTGGFDPGDEDPMRQGILRQVVAAIAEADVTICVLDSVNLPTEADRSAVELLRKSGKPVVYFANRADNPQRELEAGDLFRLGIEPLIAGSALHGRNIDALRDEISKRLPESSEPDVEPGLLNTDDVGELGFEPAEEPAQEPASNTRVTPRVALVGRPNAGKSSLLNLLWGGERVLVDDRPGTTRDSVDARVEFKGKSYTVIDTAGIRRKARVTEAVESASVMHAIRSIGSADVVVLLCDAAEGLADQDAKLLALASERGRAVIVGMNKMDLLSKREQEKAVQAAKDELHFAPWVPVLSLSIAKRQGIAPLMRAVDQSHAELTRRVGTAELNRFVAEVIDRTPPPSPGGRTPRLYYVTQASTAPPLFVFMCSSPKAIPASYRRFIQNQLRAAFGFQSVPVVVRYRERRRREQGVK